MAAPDQVSDSEASEVDLITTPSRDQDRVLSQPESVLSHRFRDSPRKLSDQQTKEGSSAAAENKIAVMVSAPSRPWEYQPYRGATTVDAVLKEIKKPGGALWYKIEYEDGKKEDVSLEKLLQIRNGQNALDLYNNGDEEVQPAISMSEYQIDRSSAEASLSSSTGKRTRTKPTNFGFSNNFVDPTKAQLFDDDNDDDVLLDKGAVKKRRLVQGQIKFAHKNGSSGQGSRISSRLSSRRRSPDLLRGNDTDDSNSEPLIPKQRGLHLTRGTRASGRNTSYTNSKPAIKIKVRGRYDDDDDEDVDELAEQEQSESENSDIVYVGKGEKKRANNRRGRAQSKGRRGRPRRAASESSSTPPERQQPTRRSGRERAVKSMKERDMDEEIYADEVSVNTAPKVISIREIFQPISKQSRFRLFHRKECDVCGGTENNSNKGSSPLIYCQGCSSAIHKVCLGYRSTREAMVTKIGHENFVMQCRRCIGVAAKKDSSAPRLDTCAECNEEGAACSAFSPRKTSKQEEKLRAENGGDDPITEVAPELINNDESVLFRCRTCQRAWHFEHLPSRYDTSNTPEDIDELRDERFKEYTPRWQCKECCEVPAKVQGLVAWRPVDRDSYIEGQTLESFREDEKEYLIKWEDKSYFGCTWMPGGWVWGVTAVIMRKAFFRRDEGANLLPKWTAEEAIPEELLRMEIVFDVSYYNGYVARSEASDKAHIHDVDQVFVKFQGLGYDEAVWEEPPAPDQEDRWSAFVAAYNEYLAGKYFKQQPTSGLKERIEYFRSLNFEKKVELKKQPASLTGGQMMPYQMEGLNWLLYNFYQKKNVILADEMGLGKTIQIISLLASLVNDNPKCWPFLIVTPNSTCPNWRREIKKWCPSLRVVAYYGGKQARDTAMEYELFPDRCSDMRAHVVVTSYEAPVDDHSKSFFKRVKWAGMIVDEGQRLKNDENLLYVALKALKTPFQVLLTGTPLQNNKRELFNLLQFLDSSINATKLDEEYEELTKENLPELHELIRPFFLRRTKIQVLKFLPPMAQVILPVTMSVVQKKLYRSILSKNPELVRSIFGQTKAVLRPSERGNLNNMLMQLRKCLCHPFLYSSAIEERSVTDAALYRNLVDASSKFQLLEIMLPKLKERGHRVLIFSQFLQNLDLVEDFLSGLELPFQRLDGTIGSLEKQKRIDAFNAPGSELFAFLLSTRAGGVGINLATADTVIIMDPDFNPHQDIQALSRAHRIGQKNKVLVFQLMTKDSAEEKIVQIGRKKMALDQALIESMGTEDDAGVDLESILKHGAEALFREDDRNDIHYDSSSVDKLLDRTQVEVTNTDDEKTAESQFSFARVWANDKGDLTEDVEADSAPIVPNFSVWEKILKQREADAAREAARNMQTFGRGKRARQAVDYQRDSMALDDEVAGSSPLKPVGKRGKKGSGSDTDFAAAAESEVEEDEYGSGGASRQGRAAKSTIQSRQTPQKSANPASKKVMTMIKAVPPKKAAFAVSKVAPQKPSKAAKVQRGSGKKPQIPDSPRKTTTKAMPGSEKKTSQSSNAGNSEVVSGRKVPHAGKKPMANPAQTQKPPQKLAQQPSRKEAQNPEHGAGKQVSIKKKIEFSKQKSLPAEAVSNTEKLSKTKDSPSKEGVPTLDATMIAEKSSGSKIDPSKGRAVPAEVSTHTEKSGREISSSKEVPPTSGAFINAAGASKKTLDSGKEEMISANALPKGVNPGTRKPVFLEASTQLEKSSPKDSSDNNPLDAHTAPSEKQISTKINGASKMQAVSSSIISQPSVNANNVPTKTPSSKANKTPSQTTSYPPHTSESSKDISRKKPDPRPVETSSHKAVNTNHTDSHQQVEFKNAHPNTHPLQPTASSKNTESSKNAHPNHTHPVLQAESSKKAQPNLTIPVQQTESSKNAHPNNTQKSTSDPQGRESVATTKAQEHSPAKLKGARPKIILRTQSKKREQVEGSPPPPKRRNVTSSTSLAVV